MKTLFALFLIIFGSQANAANKSIAVCNSSSTNVAQLFIELFEDESGKLASRYTLGGSLRYPTWTKAGKIGSPPARLPRVLSEINARRDTGIKPQDVKRFQGIFIDGSNTWAVELWKLMDSRDNVIGWMAYAYGEVFGCYR